MRIAVVLIIVLSLAVLCSPAVRADSSAAAVTMVTLNAQAMPVDQAATVLGKQAGIQIFCDTGVKGSVSGNFASIELEKLLDLIVKSNSLKWQKVYLPTPVQPDQKPTLAMVKSRADALTALSTGTVVIYDPATGKQRVFVEQESSAPKVEPDKLGLKAVYLISVPKTDADKTVADTKDLPKQFQSLEDQRMSLLSQMSSDQRIAAMQQEMSALVNMDPQTRQQVLQDQMKARQTMDPTLRDQYRQMMRDTFSAMGGGQGGPGGWGGGGRRGNRGGGGNNGGGANPGQ